VDCAGVDDHFSVGVAADEVRETQEVLDSGPAVRVEGHGVARLDACFEDSNMLVLEKHDMVCRRGSYRIESVRPFPIVGTSRHSLFCHAPIIPRRIRRSPAPVFGNVPRKT
jgi:hypothetical protein